MLGSLGASGTLKIGVVVDAAAASDATVDVRLNEAFG
jgi:predicted RecA/RadA family phage recombinase